MTEVTFRPRIAPYVIGAAFMTMVVYGVFLVIGTSQMTDHPFGLAALVGCGNLAWNLVTKVRKHGIRVDAGGITDVFSQVTLPWSEIATIKLEILQLNLQRPATIRVASLVGPRTIRFGDLGPGRPPRVNNIANLESAALLLALVTARSDAAALYPPGWTAPAPDPIAEPQRFDLKRLGGIGAATIKTGPKLFAVVGKLLKGIKLGSVVLAIGAYTLVWSWQFALALVGMILVHECGHAFAMWRSGVPVKGIYFIPFFGGAAVSKGIAKTRARAAYIAINGPIWGTLLALGCFTAFAIGDGERPFLGTLAAWGAFINLFNLLPIFPLDGGRLVASLAHASRRGVPIVAASLVLGGAVAYFAQLELLVLIGIVGLLELGDRLAAATYGPALALLARPLSAADHDHFAHHTAFVESERDTPARREVREQLFTRRKAEAEQTPMTFGQAVVVLAGYVALVGALVAVLYLTADIAGSGSPLDFLR